MELHFLNYEKELAIKANMARVEAYLAYRRPQLGLLEKSVELANCTMENKEA